MKKRIKVHGWLIFFAVIAFIAFPRYLLALPHTGKQGFLFDILCAAAIMWGYFIRISARGLKSELNPDGKTLVTSGPYSASRNPMYFGTFIIGMGLSLLLLRWWASLLFFAVYLSIYLTLIDTEEKRLAERFKEAFRDYRSKVPKFFPVSRFFDLPFKLAWINKEIFSIIPVAFLVVGAKAWADLKYLGGVRYKEELLILVSFFGMLLVYVSFGAIKGKKHGVSGKS